MALTSKQQAFINEYLKDHNGTQAAIRAGYRERGANEQAARLLANVSICEEISRRMAAAAAQADVDAARIVRELAIVAFSDMGQICDFTGDSMRLKPVSEISEAARRAISSMKVRRYVDGHGEDARDVEVTEFRLWPKTDALDKLCKKLRLYQDPLQAAKTLLSLLPDDLAARVWEGITGGHAALGQAEVVGHGAASQADPNPRA